MTDKFAIAAGIAMVWLGTGLAACGGETSDPADRDGGADTDAAVGDASGDADTRSVAPDTGGPDTGAPDTGPVDVADTSEPTDTSPSDAADTADATPVDATDTADVPETDTAADTGADPDTGESDDTCNYRGKNHGVCKDSTLDADGYCRKPSGYESEESTCDGKDNDCDGEVDETCPCETTVGVCGKGARTCSNPPGYQKEETLCDGEDNDCDGEVDEGLKRRCGTNTGVCQKGYSVCTDGRWGELCFGNTPPSDETCDGKDNDCDGKVDEHQDSGSKLIGGSCSHDCQCASGTCHSGKCAHRIFATSSTHKGYEVSNEPCQQAVKDAKIGGATQWTVIVSLTQKDAASRLEIRGPIVRTDGKKVADDRREFWSSSHANAIDVDATGSPLPAQSTARVWTGSGVGGTAAKTCDDWSPQADDTGTYGYTTEKNMDWIYASTSGLDCYGDEAHLYCIEQN